MGMYQKREQRKKAKTEDNNTENNSKININWYPGHMAKAKRLIREGLDQIDLVYEVIDARMPKSSKIVDLDDLVGKKPRILIFNKIDLCDLKETKKWMNYYEEQGYVTIGSDLTKTTNFKALFDLTKKVMEPMNLIRQRKGLKERRTRILIVGIPNVGKSTLINRLTGKKAREVGNKPGVTKNLDWIRINDQLELLDSPGILWPKLEDQTGALNLAAFSAIREEILPLYDVVEYALRSLEKYYPEKLEQRYGVREIDEDIIITLEVIGRRRGALIKGGEIDYDKVVSIVINDIKDGYIEGITFDRFEEDN